jgi:NAD(P)-dependent dehydrogenase (short-subunit alcohol dehydrogenase family)/acyl dehydratase
MFPEARVWAGDELRVGLAAEFEREVAEADVLAFAANSGDANPLHVDADYARGTAYGGRIVHGAFQVGLASALIGMHLPGRHVLLASVAARFPAPLYFPCRVRVRGEITAWNSETRAGQLKVTVVETARQTPTAEVVLGFTLHEQGPTVRLAPREARVAAEALGRKVVLVTGAAGGLGSRLVAALAGEYDVLAATHRQPLEDPSRTLPGVEEWRVDLADAELSRDGLTDVLGGRPLYGIVHAAWPGAPLGGLLQAQPEVVEHQILFGATTTIRLARWLFETAGPDGGRFVAISSAVGSQKPVITLSAYSLGKATLEGAVRLLAPELARRNVTINAVCPSFIPAGMNRHKSEQQRRVEASRVPLGRLCEPEDVAGLVGYLLSREAGFVSGQIIGLSGGQL